MTAGDIPRFALRITNRISPAGELLTKLCLAMGYVTLASALLRPDLFWAALDMLPDEAVLPVAYLVTFAYPATYVILSLVAAVAASAELSRSGDTSLRDRVHAYLAVAFGEWTIHHLLYLLFPLALLWGLFSLPMGIAYSIPVWGMLCVAAVGVLIGNRYAWYQNASDLPAETHQNG